MATKEIDYSKWDNQLDVEGLKNDIKEAEQNGGNGNYVDVPCGDYEVKIVKLDLAATKKTNDPMLSVWFEVLAGEYKGQKIFMNQVVTKGWQIHRANMFLRSLDSGVKIEFENYKQYHQMLMDIHEAIDGKLEYALEYDEDSKGYNTFEITEIYEVV